MLFFFSLGILKISNEGEALFVNFMGSLFVPFPYNFKVYPGEEEALFGK